MVENEFVAGIAGAVLAVPYVLYARRARNPRLVFALGLVIAASVYVVFAVLSRSVGDFVLGAGGVALFGMFAIAGVRRAALHEAASFLAFGWLAHAVWDWLLHRLNAASHVPWWYPALCLGFDLIVSAAIFAGSVRGPGDRLGRQR